MEAKTKQFRKRQAILDCLRSTNTHPSAEMLHAMLQAEHPDISLATVYRNLALFKRQGIVQVVGTVDGIDRFDANIDPHVHFVCDRCSAVIDLHQIAVPQQLQSSVEAATGGRMTNCHLSFTGVCQTCCQAELTA